MYKAKEREESIYKEMKRCDPTFNWQFKTIASMGERNQKRSVENLQDKESDCLCFISY